MDFESKIISRQIGDILYASGLTIGTAESCTGGRISEAIIAIPGSSDYYKGGIVAYTDEVKENSGRTSRNIRGVYGCVRGSCASDGVRYDQYHRC